MTVKLGLIMISVGSIVVARRHIKKKLSHLYLYFASANPHMELIRRVMIVAMNVMNVVFIVLMIISFVQTRINAKAEKEM